MKLGIQEAAKLLSVSEKTVYRWIGKGVLPVHRIQDQYRFNRSELLAWAVSRRIKVAEEAFHDSLKVSGPIPTLVEAVCQGGIHYRVNSKTKEEALRASVDLARVTDEHNSSYLLSLVLAREGLAPTGIGGGLAIPQLIYPNLLELHSPLITLAFLDEPVDYDSLDGQPVFCLLSLFSPSLRGYHILLNRLYYALSDKLLRQDLQKQSARNTLLDHFKRIEGRLRPSQPE